MIRSLLHTCHFFLLLVRFKEHLCGVDVEDQEDQDQEAQDETKCIRDVIAGMKYQMKGCDTLCLF